jgi:uncharacterized membrane protein
LFSQHANNTGAVVDALMTTDANTQRRRDRMLAASVHQRIPDVMTFGRIVAAANAMGGSSGGASFGVPATASGYAESHSGIASAGGWDDRDYYFHGAIGEGHWLAMLVAAGFLNDTFGLSSAHALFVQHAVVLRVIMLVERTLHARFTLHIRN